MVSDYTLSKTGLEEIIKISKACLTTQKTF